MLPDCPCTAVQAQLYYDPNSTYFFTLDYKKCAKMCQVSQHFGAAALSSPITWHNPRVFTGPIHPGYEASTRFLLVLGRYFVYDSEVQLLCLVDSQVHLWEQVEQDLLPPQTGLTDYTINIYQHVPHIPNIHRYYSVYIYIYIHYIHFMLFYNTWMSKSTDLVWLLTDIDSQYFTMQGEESARWRD